MSGTVSLNDQATQSGFARLVGTSQPAIAKHVQAGVLPQGETYGAWLQAYCERLRTEAAGRQVSDARNRRDMAQALESEANAQLKLRELYRQDQLIVDMESVHKAMAEWATVGKNEFLGAVESILIAIESQHAITVERESLQPDIDAALRAIGGYEIEPAAPGAGDTHNLDTAA
ncbi:hypothetical protein [Microbulbifer spongiae]|uniref:Terminase small subunit n=1 Tax=Microbulbifer spongiae TaxID=2944933 RepID=A0ABY9EFK1_9GAMM|nr:hypothetical protein [Microbulbifer sp. MI-G]WKD51729.1 hypothetical protein M8T91_18630 [Microbulbifer sp. MI-G]